MAAIILARTSGYISAHSSGHKCGICGIRFIAFRINISINLGMDGFKKANADFSFRCSVKTTFLNVADIGYGMLGLKLSLK